MPPSLPGYYFDPEKNRYFKIQANHVAPTGAKYSRQAVKAEKVIKKVQRRDESVQRSKVATTVTRSKLLQHPLLSFDRRLGEIRSSLTSHVAEYYAASLCSRDALTSAETYPGMGLFPTSDYFAVDHDSGTLFSVLRRIRMTQTGGPRLLAFHRNEKPFDEQSHFYGDGSWRMSPKRNDAGALYSSLNCETIARVASVENITSIGSGLVLWVQGHGESHIPVECRVMVGACNTGPFSNRRDLVHQAVFYNRIQDVAVQPRSALGPSNLAVLATGSSLWLMDTSTWRYPMAQYPLNQNDGTNDLMKIHFKDHNILMGGTRSGKMLLLDIREPSTSSTSRSSSTRIQHSGAVTNLRCLPDGNSILLAGLSTTETYDIRYAPLPSLKCHLPRSNSYRHSPSVLTFNIPETRRQNQYGLGWAYDPELDIMVAASTDHVKNHRVGIWSVQTGRMVKSPLNDFVSGAPVGSLDIVRVRDGPKSILVGGGDGVMEWTCHGSTDNDSDTEMRN
ncbi:hypothetical protein H2200_000745 [Cladophialophora chaetospira]|uniref:Myocyte-specific enhancer factor 2d n=1 Tax=Cladophialophora chaetospira TaxID=386627 RepID=A0AA38XQ33_9EURO|nr:hypothetical protein H2200_000745 [Cladophialophora chaetospira]